MPNETRYDRPTEDYEAADCLRNARGWLRDVKNTGVLDGLSGQALKEAERQIEAAARYLRRKSDATSKSAKGRAALRELIMLRVFGADVARVRRPGEQSREHVLATALADAAIALEPERVDEDERAAEIARTVHAFCRKFGVS